MLLTDSLIRILSFLYQEKDNKVYTSIISKKTDKTSSHVVKVINELQNKGYVKKEKSGRIKFISLTDKGLKIGENCNDLVNNLK